MKILLLLLPMLSFAGISKYGDYYLENYRSHFINPARLAETEGMIYALSKGEIGYKNDNYIIFADKKKIGAGVLLMENVGLEGFISALNGSGVESYGLTIGFGNIGGNGFYMGFSDGEHQDFLPKFGFSIAAYDGTLFGEYTGQIISVPTYEFKVGYGKTFGQIFFGDLTYKQINEDDRALMATVGAKAFVFERIAGLAAVSKELFFAGELMAKVGIEFYATNHIEFSITHDLTAFSLPSPKYKDFDIKAGVKYLF